MSRFKIVAFCLGAIFVMLLPASVVLAQGLGPCMHAEYVVGRRDDFYGGHQKQICDRGTRFGVEILWHEDVQAIFEKLEILGFALPTEGVWSLYMNRSCEEVLIDGEYDTRTYDEWNRILAERCVDDRSGAQVELSVTHLSDDYSTYGTIRHSESEDFERVEERRDDMEAVGSILMGLLATGATIGGTYLIVKGIRSQPRRLGMLVVGIILISPAVLVIVLYILLWMLVDVFGVPIFSSIWTGY